MTCFHICLAPAKPFPEHTLLSNLCAFIFAYAVPSTWNAFLTFLLIGILPILQPAHVTPFLYPFLINLPYPGIPCNLKY